MDHITTQNLFLKRQLECLAFKKFPVLNVSVVLGIVSKVSLVSFSAFRLITD